MVVLHLVPLATCVITRTYAHRAIAALYVLTFIGCAYMVGGVILALFPAWILGALLHLIPRRQKRASVWLLIVSSVIYVAAICAFAVIAHQSATFGHVPHLGEICDNCLGILTAAYLWLLLSDRRRAPNSWLADSVRGSARFSYTLYVAHLPLLIFASSLLVHDSRWIPDLGHGIVGLLVLTLTILYSWSFAWLVEFRTDTVRAWIEVRLGIKSRQIDRFASPPTASSKSH